MNKRLNKKIRIRKRAKDIIKSNKSKKEKIALLEELGMGPDLIVDKWIEKVKKEKDKEDKESKNGK